MPIAHPLAYCPTCKTAFPLATGREGGTFVVQNSTTTCPNGHFARVLTPHYQAIEAEMRAALEGRGQATRKVIRSLWERLSRRDMTPEQAQAEADATGPGLALIFSAANFADPTRKAILETLITDFVAGLEPDEEALVVEGIATSASPTPEAPTHREMPEKRKGGNRAFQRSLRHKQRMLMNPRVR
jgi:uncharacterized membrane protein